MTFTITTKVADLPTKPDANSDLWNVGFTQIDANFATLEGGSAGEYWGSGGSWSVPTGTGVTNGHVIFDEAVELTQRTNMYFEGAGVEVTNGAGGTEVTISGEPTNSGTSFPGSPTAGDRFFRSDLGLHCYYDADGDWVTVADYGIPFPEADYTVTTDNINKTWLGDNYQPKFTVLELRTRVSTTNDGSNYWTVTIVSLALDNSAEVIKSFNTGADTVNVYTDKGSVPAVPNPTDNGGIKLITTKTGSPGTLRMSVTVYFKKIIP